MGAAIRELSSPAEFKQTEALQRAAWYMDDADVVPGAAMIAIAHEGGLVAGAFDGEQMVGFVFGFPTADPRRQHSHMLAVLPAYRRTGLGVRLKLFQRDWCLARGIEQVVWTYDPLMGLNASFNVRKLGCVVRTYLPDFYGPLSGVNAGAPTDRFLAEWDLASSRVAQHVRRLLDPEGRGAGASAEEAPGVAWANVVDGEKPAQAVLDLEAPRLGVAIPEQFGHLLRSDPDLALRWRLHAREVFTHYFARGYAVTGFVRQAGRNAYILEKAGTTGSPSVRAV